MTILGHFSKEFERTTDRDLRILIKEKIIKFKEKRSDHRQDGAIRQELNDKAV